MKPLTKYLAPLLVTVTALACSFSGAAVSETHAPTQPPPAPTSTPTPAPTATVPPLTAQMLRNGTYTLPVSGKTVQLQDGKYQAGEGADYLAVGIAEPVGFGDLNGDSAADAAVVLGENTGGSGVFESLVAVLNQAGKPTQAAAVQIGDRVQVKEVAIRDGKVTLNEVVPGPQDPLCCPTQPETAIYRLSKGSLLLDRLVSQTPEGTTRAITIDSPTAGAQVGDRLQATGSETIAPFENTLTYRVYDAENNLLAEGSLTAQSATPGEKASFSGNIDLSKVQSGTKFWLQILDRSAADGSTLALASVELQKE